MKATIQKRNSQSNNQTFAIQQKAKPLKQFKDNRPNVIAQRQMWQNIQPIQKQEKPNNTGLPDNLKSGIENLSGYSMDDVNVHYNSPKPTQLQAHAYAQGTDIHVASGQEQHLPHEAWHVVQQKQGRVKPTMQLQGVNVNDNMGLEREADVMGDKIDNIQFKTLKGNKQSNKTQNSPIQRVIHDDNGNFLPLQAIKNEFDFRHKVSFNSDEYSGYFEMLKIYENEKAIWTISDLVADFQKSTPIGNKDARFTHLLSLIKGKVENTQASSSMQEWGDFEDALEFIKNNKNVLNDYFVYDAPIQELIGSIPSFIPTSQWQAATENAIEANWINFPGYTTLKDLLQQIDPPVNIKLTKSLLQILSLKLGQKRGLVTPPDTDIDIKSLNEKSGHLISPGAGYYEKKDDNVIEKSLDFGHKMVDKWENVKHRKEGTQVSPSTNFKFLSLQSPKEDSQKVIGANGGVLGDGNFMFTITPNFMFRYMPAANFVGEGGTNKSFFQFIPHSQLAQLGNVVAAGNFEIRNGEFIWIDNGSGHYRVNTEVNTTNTKACLQNLGYDIDNIEFKDRSAGELDEKYSKENEILEALPKGEHRPEMTPEIRVMSEVMDLLNN